MTLLEAYRRLDDAWGPQHWWPGESRLEIMVGAVLTQNTAWSNVERAIANLKAAGALSIEALLALSLDELAALIRPAGYFNVKARRLRALLEWVSAAGGEEALAQWSDDALRAGLLGVRGVGPETADDILLYAFGRPVFVIDAYTRRILGRLGLVDPGTGYEHLRAVIEAELPPDVPLYNQFHALLVAHGKEICRSRPRCAACVLRDGCPAATL
ncbi:endonuclease III domain-containing protein [Thiofaba sp. EF100]|uniref:endonuclease III domain-containing protein n=1 Tax=Thiofaba sp. EF100 TaxID=3121274 RepID=UPI003222179C